jgi:hypothetical protein
MDSATFHQTGTEKTHLWSFIPGLTAILPLPDYGRIARVNLQLNLKIWLILGQSVEHAMRVEFLVGLDVMCSFRG